MSFTFNHEKQVDQMSFILFYKEGIAAAAGVLAERIESHFLKKKKDSHPVLSPYITQNSKLRKVLNSESPRDRCSTAYERTTIPAPN